MAKTSGRGGRVRGWLRSRRVFARREPRGGGRRRWWLGGLLMLALAGWFGLFHEDPTDVAERRRNPLPGVLSAGPGEVRVVDGDTLRLGGVTVRLAGLDAPERGQECQRADGARFDCGEAAARQLATLVDRRAVTCDTQGRDRYGRAIATCRAEGVDLAEAMVASGWAVAVAEGGRGQARYGLAEAQARSGLWGLWEGRFQTPESWRRGN